jgi:hypothetical protein
MVSHHTVAAVRDELQVNGQIAHNAERTESTGRKARGRKPKAKPRRRTAREAAR